MNTPVFKQLSIQGKDTSKFLQSQLTININKLDSDYRSTAIANLKGRIEFGIWVQKIDDTHFNIVISEDCLSTLQQHLKKYGAFSKITVTEPENIYPCIEDKTATFTNDEAKSEPMQWVYQSIATGNYWITELTQGMFQPQELRLHQRGGVDYDKGCYMGQEVIARIYFKAAPKAFLHRVQGQGEVPKDGMNIDNIQVVNAVATKDGTGFEALVVARPEKIEESQLQVLDLPPALQASVAREK